MEGTAPGGSRGGSRGGICILSRTEDRPPPPVLVVGPVGGGGGAVPVAVGSVPGVGTSVRCLCGAGSSFCSSLEASSPVFSFFSSSLFLLLCMMMKNFSRSNK
jgi:hypothetical protein